MIYEMPPGETIEEACRKICRVADAADCSCFLGFNEINLVANPRDDPDELLGLYWAAVNKRHSKASKPMRTKAEVLAELAEVREQKRATAEREAALEKELEGVREWVVREKTFCTRVEMFEVTRDKALWAIKIDPNGRFGIKDHSHARALAELCRDELNALDAGVPGCREVLEEMVRWSDNCWKGWDGEISRYGPPSLAILRKWADFHLPNG